MSKELIIDPSYGYLRFKELPSIMEVEEYYKKEYYSTKHKNLMIQTRKVKKKIKNLTISALVIIFIFF